MTLQTMSSLVVACVKPCYVVLTDVGLIPMAAQENILHPGIEGETCQGFFLHPRNFHGLFASINRYDSPYAMENPRKSLLFNTTLSLNSLQT